MRNKLNTHTLICATLLTCALYTQVSWAKEQEENPVPQAISKKYEGEKEVVCGGKTYEIPTYFPYEIATSQDEVYIDVECSRDTLTIYLGFTKNCFGRNVCSISSFSHEKISDYMAHRISLALHGKNKTVEFDGTQEGFYIPSVCFAYCNEMGMLWMSDSRVYNIGSKMQNGYQYDAEELRKSAESYLKNLKK